MTKKQYSFLQILFAQLRAKKLRQTFEEKRRGRALRFEPLERRELLAVDLMGAENLYDRPAVESEYASEVVLSTNETVDFSTGLTVESQRFSPVVVPTFEQMMESLGLIRLDVAPETSEASAAVAVENEAFIVDGVEYVPLSPQIEARRVFFETDGATAEESFDEPSVVVALPDDSSNGSGLLATSANNGRSGGSGGSSEPWDLEITTSLVSSVSALASSDCVNPLLESRSVESGGSNFLTNADYLTVMVPALPIGYSADVWFDDSLDGSAQIGVDYEVYMPNGFSSSYIAAANGFEYSGGATTFYLVPINDATVEELETVVVNLETPYWPGSGGCDNPVTFNEITMQATATLVDDDRLKVNVEATDETAIERLPGVEQDYGYYAFRRTHENENIPCDSSYGIVVDFSVYVSLSSPYYCAVRTTDYVLSATPLDANDANVYLQNLQYLGATETVTLDDGTTCYYDRYRGTIPANQTSATVRLEAAFDWLDEGDEFALAGDPGDQTGEKVRVTVVDATWGGKETWNALGENLMAEIEIRDGAISTTFFDYNGDGEYDICESNDRETGVLPPNNDDDNENGIEDRLETSSVLDEDDLRKLQPFVWVDLLARLDGSAYVVSAFINFLGTTISVWTDEEGTMPYEPTDANGIAVPHYGLTDATTNPGYSDELYIEGVSGGAASAQISTEVSVLPENGEATEVPGLGTSGGFDYYTSEYVVDIDIDSDNSLLGDKSQPNRSPDEDFFENYVYASGKIMRPNWGDFDNDGVADCWEGFSNGGANHCVAQACGEFYPIVLQIPDEVPLDSMSVQLTYPMAGLVATNGLSNPPKCGDGTIRIWKKNGFYARNGLNVTVGGDLVMSSSDNLYYTPEQLGFTETNRTIILYVEAVKENSQTTRQLVDEKGLPNTTIDFSVTIEVGEEIINCVDKVRYVVADEGSFYYELMTHPELVSTYTSEAIYRRADETKYCFKIQNCTELQELGFTSDIIRLLRTKDVIDGLNVAVYREYITGKYVLTFAGTNPLSLDDWITNVQQALGFSGVSQYTSAKNIGLAIQTNQQLNLSDWYITGHSLGGGLASAASIVSGLHAYTFNASGLHQNTVNDHENLAIADQLVDSYRVDYDILSWGQWITGWLNYLFETPIPDAIGTPITIDSEYDSEVLLNGISTVASMVSQQYTVAALRGLKVVVAGIKCHTMPQVIYGMEKRIFE